MKYLSTLILFISSSAFSLVYTLDIALEAKSISIDYSDISKTGVMRIIGCTHCEKSSYVFDQNIRIKKQGQDIDLDVLLKEYWDIKYPTMFLDKNTHKIIRINY